MSKPTDIRIKAAELYFLPVQTRVPLKFGAETLTEVACVRICLRVVDRLGRMAQGWGETPLSTQWVWPSHRPLTERTQLLQDFCVVLTNGWLQFDCQAHPLEIGSDFMQHSLPGLLEDFNREHGANAEPMPWLAALVCASAFDIALHDAFGNLVNRPVYSTYGPEFMNRDLGDHLDGSPGVSFAGMYPQEFISAQPQLHLPAWHLVGGLDLLDADELTGGEPNDGHPLLLRDWIKRDGLRCLKIKLRGNDAAWDFARIVRVGRIALSEGVEWLSADFNCMVEDLDYVIQILDQLRCDFPTIYDCLLYVEQPFPYDLEQHQMDVRKLAAIKPLFLDESAHDWRVVQLGRSLGWNGVALKTCKTQSGALLSLCWARAHGMQIMVQDLTNPMLAQIPHVLLAAHANTIMGVETNAMQFYPAASSAEAAVHPGLYQRRNGRIDLTTIQGPGFGYRLDEMRRTLPPPAAACE